jgi:hypothetical protein
VFAFAPSLDAVTATLALEVADENAPWRRKWLEEKNARGEALLLLRDGRVLIFKKEGSRPGNRVRRAGRRTVRVRAGAAPWAG